MSNHVSFGLTLSLFHTQTRSRDCSGLEGLSVCVCITKLRRMGRRIINFLPFFHLAAILLCSGAIENRKVRSHEDERLQNCVSISSTQNDITTPITTVPTATPSTMLNPEPIIMNPVTTVPLATNSWCIASPSVSQSALQTALDYACSHGADCSAIQAGASCYNPNTLRDHASFAFNSYYHQNPIPTSCNFGGTALTTSSNPSLDTCQYPSTSTSSSLLNITNSSGSRVFGAGRPITPSTSAAAGLSYVSCFYCILASVMTIVALQYEALPSLFI